MPNPRPSRSELHAKALFAASTVVLAMTAACLDRGTLTGDTDLASDGETDSPGLQDRDTDDSDRLADSDDDSDAQRDTDLLAETDPSAEPTCVDAADMSACCDARRTWCEGTLDVAASEDAINDCVFGPDFDGSTGCIPWGPPAPPAARVA